MVISNIGMNQVIQTVFGEEVMDMLMQMESIERLSI